MHEVRVVSAERAQRGRWPRAPQPLPETGAKLKGRRLAGWSLPPPPGTLIRMSGHGGDRARQVAYCAYVLTLLAVVAVTLPTGLREVVRAPTATLLWIAFIAAANMLSIRVLPALDASVATPVSVASAIVLSPPLAVVVNLLGFTNEREWKRSTTLLPILFNRAQAALSAGAAGAVAQMVGADGLLAPTLAAVAVYISLNTAFVTVALWIRRSVRLPRAVKVSAAPFRGFAFNFAVIALLSLLIVLAARQVAGIAAVVAAVPMWLGYSALRHAGVSAEKAAELADRVADLELLNSLSERLVSVATSQQVVAAVEEALGGLRREDEEPVSLVLSDVAAAEDDPEAAVIDARDVRPAMAPAGDSGTTEVAIPGMGGAALVIDRRLAERHIDVLTAAVGLAGMALQRVALEQHVREAEVARGRLSEEILEEGTRERSRVALLIHDDVLPYLAATQIQADNVASALALGRSEQASELAGAVGAAMQDGMRRLREVLTSLREQIVTPGTLREGLAGLVEDVKVTAGVSGVLDCPDPLPPLPHAVEILAYEVVRGCLSNVVRHAMAPSVAVTVAAGEGRLVVAVTDDGTGFDPAAVDSSHHGLSLMASRVALSRGDLRVDSAPGEGTTVTATFAL